MKESAKRFLTILMAGMLVTCTGCAKHYEVNYGGRKSAFQNAKSTYREGEKVSLVFDVIATDTDYSFYVEPEDGSAPSVPYSVGSRNGGYVLSFTMPGYPVRVGYTARNSMAYEIPVTPEPERGPSAEYGEPLISTSYGSIYGKTVTYIGEKRNGLYAENLLAMTELLGREPAEAGIPEKCTGKVSERDFYTVPFEGGLFGAADCRGSFSNDILRETKTVVRKITLYTYDLGGEEALNRFEALYGEPCDEDMEPYVASNGGAVLRITYDAGSFYATVAMGTERDYLEITFTLK